MSVLRALIVDDQRSMRLILRGLLKQCGVEQVLEAANGARALEALEQLCRANQSPDFIICDLHMETMDGMELLNRIRRGKEKIDAHIPFLLLTGEQDPLMLEVVEQVGATTILPKPISAVDLASSIARAVGIAGTA
jgi:CheY-like chemotaxis protein